MKKYLPIILRFFLVAIVLQVGRELEIDKQIGGLITALLTLFAFVWAFRGNEVFSYRPGQNLSGPVTKEKKVIKEKKVSPSVKTEEGNKSNTQILLIVIIGLLLVIIGMNYNNSGSEKSKSEIIRENKINNLKKKSKDPLQERIEAIKRAEARERKKKSQD